MNGNPEISEREIDQFLAQIQNDAAAGGYRLNPDLEFTRELARSLLINQKRYGYPSCPCRLAGGERQADLDIVCPCDYRDPDLNDYEACYCALYVSGAIISGEKKLKPIPERRAVQKTESPIATKKSPAGDFLASLPYPVWRCKVCGYLCARENPSEICPICKAKKERFEKFI